MILYFIYVAICVICLFTGILIIIFSREKLKTGINLILYSAIGFLIAVALWDKFFWPLEY